MGVEMSSAWVKEEQGKAISELGFDVHKRSRS
jgi:hypothetical protein